MFLIAFVATRYDMVQEMFLVFPGLDSQFAGEAVESGKVSLLVVLIDLAIELMDFLVRYYLRRVFLHLCFFQ